METPTRDHRAGARASSYRAPQLRPACGDHARVVVRYEQRASGSTSSEADPTPIRSAASPGEHSAFLRGRLDDRARDAVSSGTVPRSVLGHDVVAILCGEAVPVKRIPSEATCRPGSRRGANSALRACRRARSAVRPDDVRIARHSGLGRVIPLVRRQVVAQHVAAVVGEPQPLGADYSRSRPIWHAAREDLVP